MKAKTIYLVLCAIGAVLPYWQFVPWLMERGFNPTLFFREMVANRISAFFALDVLVSAIVLIIFIEWKVRVREYAGAGFRFWQRFWLGCL
jgi:hypothetical protein